MYNYDDKNLIEGKNAIYETLKAGSNIKIIYIDKNVKDKKIDEIVNLAKDKKVIYKFVDNKEIDRLSSSKKSQGIIAEILEYNYYDIEDIFDEAKNRNEKPFILILDEIEDPHNFGAIIRTASQVGVHGIIIKNRNQVQVTKTVIEVSSGATNYMKIVRVNNLSNAIDELKERGVFIYSASMEGNNIYNTNLTGSIALVVGSEGKGVSRLVKERSDEIISIPQKGDIDSLNVSVATGVIVYEIYRQRNVK